MEFVTATIPPGLSDYHFGFVDGPQNTDIAASAAAVANANSDVLFTSGRTPTNTSAGSVQPKANEVSGSSHSSYMIVSCVSNGIRFMLYLDEGRDLLSCNRSAERSNKKSCLLSIALIFA